MSSRSTSPEAAGRTPEPPWATRGNRAAREPVEASGEALRTRPALSFARREAVSQLVGAGRSQSLVAYAHTIEQCRAVIDYCREHQLTLCPRGSGHSYGDMPLNDGHVLLDTTGMARILDFDISRGQMVVEPGVQIIDVYKTAHPHMFMLPASPSEGTITVAGAVSNNVNGKDSWRVGNFADQVIALRLMTSDGAVRTVSRTSEPDVFAAVSGGMGMLGIIVEVTLQLVPITTPYVETSRMPARSVPEMLRLLERAEAESDYAVAWVDVYGRGSETGRSVIHTTRWLERPERARHYVDDLLRCLERLAVSRHRAIVAYDLLSYLTAALMHVQRVAVPLFNRLYLGYCSLRNRLRPTEVELFIEYNFFPNLQIPPAAVVCGPRGYTVQVLFPREHAQRAITEALEICRSWPCPPVTTVLRIHRADDNLLSFSADGYSLNFEIHPTPRQVTRMRPGIDALVECTIRHAGRVHLAKDHVLRATQFQGLFPRHQEFLAVKERLDPEHLFSSNMFRRLFPSDSSGTVSGERGG